MQNFFTEMGNLTYKRAKLSNIFGEYIVFRELNPVKKELPDFEKIKAALSLKKLPRKKDKEYAEALSYIFSSIRKFEKVFYIGDTLMSDLSVIKNFARIPGFKVFGVITREGEMNGFELKENFLMNGRWANLREAITLCEEKIFRIDDKTVLIIDIDKTAIGGRGRNDKAIDKARIDAIRELASEIFGKVEEERFSDAYRTANRREFFYITEDNQDIISILSFLLYDGTVSVSEIEGGKFNTVIELLEKSHSKNEKLTHYVMKVLENIKSGNPTAFPSFRKKEFQKTIARSDFLPDETPISTLLSEEIMITGEVFDVAEDLKKRGTLVFGVSDKPALSTMPIDGEELPPVYEKTMKVYSEV